MMSFIYRQSGRRIYRGRYRLQGQPTFTDLSLKTADKQVAEQKLKALIREVEQEAAGIVAPKALRDAAQKSMADHLQDYLNDLLKLGRVERHISNIEWRGNKLIKECGWKLPKDVTPDSFQAWRSGQDLAPKTLNDYLGAASGLLNWMTKNGRILANPLRAVSQVATRGREQRVRRAFNDDEVKRLLAIAGLYKPVYLTALYTGLRRSELASLQWNDVELDSDIPSITVRASISKNHLPAKLPLHADVFEELRKLKPHDATDDQSVFKRIPRIERFKRDLKKAGIVYVDAQGRVADFHSLRKTFCTNMARYSVPSRTAMTLMRHRDRRLTDMIYTDEQLLGTSSAIKKLPSYGDGGCLSIASLTGDVSCHKPPKSSHHLSSTGTSGGNSDDVEGAVNKWDMHVLSPTCTNNEFEKWRERRGSNPPL